MAYREKQVHPSTWIVNLSKALLCYYPYIDLHIITESNYVNYNFTTKYRGISFHVVRSGSAPPFLLRGYPSFFPLDIISRYYFNRHLLLKELKNIKPDIVHAHGTEAAYAITAVKSPYPAIISIQGIMQELSKYQANMQFRHRVSIEREAIQNGKYFIVKTPFAAKFVNSLNSHAVLFDIENSINEVFFSVKREGKVHRNILFVGTIIKTKGVEELIDSLPLVPNCRLTIIGSGHSRYIKFLQKKARKNGVAGKIEWKGSVSSQMVADEMKKADCLALPSYMDTSPNVISEAMCAGLPVVATKVGGIPDMIKHNYTGLLIDPRNEKELTHAICFLLENQTKINEMRDRARLEGRRRFAPLTSANKVMKAYENVLTRSSNCF